MSSTHQEMGIHLTKTNEGNFMNEHRERAFARIRRQKRDKNVEYKSFFLVCTYNVIKNIYYLNFIAEFLILKQ